MQQLDEQYMHRCLQLAAMGAGAVPHKVIAMVGAVIVHENKIIGEGWHRAYGTPHAEVNAVASVSAENRINLSKSTLYCSLEPCHHYGKTPPCVDLVLRCGFRRVVIALTDPNPLVAGKSIELLRSNGVAVVLGVLADAARAQNIAFLTFMERKRPHIILKWAESSDGFIGKPNEQIWLTNPISRRLVHRWRSETMAIIVGTNTLKTDNPLLDTRLWTGNAPLRIILDKNADIINNEIYNVNNNTDNNLYIIDKQNKVTNEDSKNIAYLDFKNSNFLHDLMDLLYQKNINSLFVEGGAKLLQSFIDTELWDEVRVFRTTKILSNGIAAPILQNAKIANQQQINSDTLSMYHS